MKSKLIICILFLLNFSKLFAENINIEAKNISIDKNQETTIFENEVKVTTEDNVVIESDYAKYNKKLNFLILKNNVKAIDKEGNKIKTNFAEYNDLSKIFKTTGATEIQTSQSYIISTQDILLDNKKKYISSDKNTIITDLDQNEFFLEGFSYETNFNIFKSIGSIKIKDKLENSYEFSQIYIDTQKKEILGTDVKAFFNDKNFKIHKDNKPRIFSNTIKTSKDQSLFKKSVFTICNYRKDDKCPPWTIQATEMLHDNKKKTIFYDNAIVKVYDIPIFYIPRLSHPDPSVERRSGFLPPSFSDSKNLGSGMSIPYFWALNDDKNFTLTNKFYVTENPLFLGEYHQAFQNSNFLADFGYTEGYKTTSGKKRAGNKSHIFAKFIKNFTGSDDSEKSLSLSVQNVSNDKYLKLYKINSNLVDYNTSTLENSINYTFENGEIFFGFNSSIYETLNEDYNDKYEYIFPDITFDKNLISNEKIGSLDIQTNYKVRKYDTNKFTNFLVNDFIWNYKEINYQSGLKGKILGHIKNINYETKNEEIYKKDTTSEILGAIGYLTELNLQKNIKDSNHYLTPKLLIRYAPGIMRNESSGSRLNPISAFSLNRLNNNYNFETGFSGTVGFDYEIKNNSTDFDFSVAQIISEKENKKMPSKTSLDEKVSDLVGSVNYKINDKIKLNYNFNVDQNYKEINYNEFGTSLNFDPMEISFNYLHEDKHVGDQEYFKTKLDFSYIKNGLISFENKRNLVTNSSEYYNLSYEYLNDCLRAGLVYRREFYNDSELEPENSLMFKITLTPFGDINSPSFNK